MIDLECESCGMFADRVQDISWYDGYSSIEVQRADSLDDLEKVFSNE